jgi:hypothetical protein
MKMQKCWHGGLQPKSIYPKQRAHGESHRRATCVLLQRFCAQYPGTYTLTAFLYVVLCRVTVGGDGGVVEPDRELGESPPDNPIAELDTADWFHGRGNFYSCSSFLSFFSCCVFLLLRPPRLISLEFVSISVPCLRVSAITTCTHVCATVIIG